MFRRIILISSVIASMATTPLVFAHGAKPSHQQCSIICVTEMTKQLDLTTRQQDKIKSIKHKANRSLHQHYAQMRAVKIQINGLIKSDKLNHAKLNELISKKKEIIASITTTRIVMHNAIYNTLNKDQKAKFAQMMDKEAKARRTKNKTKVKHVVT